MKIKSVFLLGPALLLAGTLFGQAQRGPMGPPEAPTQPSNQGPDSQLPKASATRVPTTAAVGGPMTEKEVISELKKSGADQLIKDLGTRGVDFEMDEDTTKRLHKAKATDQVIQAVTSAGPKERAAAAKAAAMASGQILIPPEQSGDFKTLETELDPDKAIALAQAFVQKYPQSEALSYIYMFEANAYQQKGDAPHIVEFAEKSLELKKDNLMTLIMAAYTIPTPQFLHDHQGDEEKQLGIAEGYIQDGYKAIDALKPMPNEQDAEFAKRKAGYTASLHSAAGMIDLDRAQEGLMGLDREELAKAEKEYRQAVSLVENPEAADYFRLGETCRLQGKFDDAITAFTKASELSQGQMKQLADQQVDLAKKQKAMAAAAPAKP